MIIIFTGEGKGKTSAALGTALRASGWGKKVAVIQFIKGNKEIGEWQAIQELPNIDIFQFLDDNRLFIGKPTDNHRASMKTALETTTEVVSSGKYQLVVLDEINNAISHGLVNVDWILNLIAHCDSDFVLTGRDADPKLIEIADTVTEMKKIKHPFDSGKLAKKGIDY
jgi:cob(I)alamin adenosyltransferase